MAGPCTPTEHADNVALLNGADGRINPNFLQLLNGHQTLINALLEGCRLEGILLTDLHSKSLEIFIQQMLATLENKALNDIQRANLILQAVVEELEREREETKKLFRANSASGSASASSNAKFDAAAANSEWLTVDKATYVIEDLNRLYPLIQIHFPRGTSLNQSAKQAAVDSLNGPDKKSAAYVLVASSNAHWVVHRFDIEPATGAVREHFFNPRGDGYCGDRALAFIEEDVIKGLQVKPTILGPHHALGSDLRVQTERHVADYIASVPSEGKKALANKWYDEANKVIAVKMTKPNVSSAQPSANAARTKPVVRTATVGHAQSLPVVTPVSSPVSPTTPTVNPAPAPVVSAAPVAPTVSVDNNAAKTSLPVVLVAPAKSEHITDKAEHVVNKKANEYLDELFAKQEDGVLTEKQVDEKVRQLFKESQQVFAKTGTDVTKTTASIDKMFEGFRASHPTAGYPTRTASSCASEAKKDVKLHGSTVPRLVRS